MIALCRSIVAGMLGAACVVSVVAGAARPAAAENNAAPHGKLVELMPAVPGTRACFTRSYDAAHLRAHPKQRVSALTFLLRVVRYDAKGDLFLTPQMGPDDRTEYQFAMEVKRRGQGKALRTGGYCYGDDVATCVVECDGGGATLKPAAEGGALTVQLMDYGIRMTGDCDDEEGTWLRPGSDDKVFRVDKAAPAACRALEKEELGE